jgi:hypothetical protein
MADEWYFMKNGRKMGPLSSKTIVDLAASGKLLPTDSIQKKGAATWQEASAVKGLFPKSPIPETIPTNPDDSAEPFLDAALPVEDSSLTPPPIPRQTIPKDKVILSRHADMTVIDIILRVAGLLLIVGGIVWLAMMLVQGYGHRFREDNAVGATANAAEAIWLSLVAWLHILGGISLYLYSSVRRIRRKVLESP